jgi:O-antigen/teichoic acid export membrane protein
VTSLVVGPQVSRHYHSGEMDKLRRLLKLTAVTIFLPSLLGFIAIAMFSEQILGLFGPTFLAVKTELIILAGGQAINAATGCVRIVTNMTGHQRQAAIIQIPLAILASIAMAIGAWMSGSLGVAWVVAGAVAVTNLAMWAYVRRYTGLDPSLFGVVFPPKIRS